MSFEQKIQDIIETMIEWNMLDRSRLLDTDYVAERINMYLKARHFIHENFKGCF